jgi:hypothetical protein
MESMPVADIGYWNLFNQMPLQNSDVVLSRIFSSYSTQDYSLLLGCSLTDQEDLSNSD